MQRIFAALLALCQLLCLASAAGATSIGDVNVVAASMVTNSSAIDGMVRVYLSSLGNPSTLNVTIAGSYSVNGDASQSLASGSSVTVSFDSSTGAIMLTRNGQTYNMGRYFALRRHGTDNSNGVKISQAKVSANPYPGDLSFQSVPSGSGYKLYTVAHIYIENYLYGVLPYEMGNSSSLEALKAQAVAARTYTVRMMQSRSGGYYDVVDTTSDQVYRGTPSGNANCVAAVDATKGVLLKYGTGYTMTYYSASNGGQTESVKNAWGTSGYDYLKVKDDPFDYANTASTVKSATVYANLSSASNSSALLNLLKSKAVSALASSGYNATYGNTVLQTLKSVTPHTPKYASPSRLYTKMDFAITASTLSSSGQTVTANVTVTCGIFSELESLLSLGIQSTQNELWSVKTGASSFVIQARRYGHGLGMSQRGAMYMGKLGYTYDEILGFYYEGCQRVRQSFTNKILSQTGSEQTTVEEAAELTGNETSTCKGTVKLVSSGASLAIRASKSTSASVIGTLNNGAIVTVLADDGTWCFVRYGNLQGYVPKNALSVTGTPTGTEESATTIQGFCTVTASDYVNLRKEGSMSAQVLTTAPGGAVLTVFSVTGDWAYVQYCSTVAYVSRSFISAISAAYPSQVVSTGSAAAIVKTEDGTGSVNLRSTPSTDGAVLCQVPNGASLTVANDDGSWATVTYNGQSGYMMSSFLRYDESAAVTPGEPTPTPTPTPDDGGDEAPSGLTATVNVDVTYLREQPNAASPSKLLLVKGDVVIVSDKGESWCLATCEMVTGYISAAELTFASAPQLTPTPAPTEEPSQNAGLTAVVATQSGSLNMRTQGKAGSPILTTIPKGAQVSVTERGNTWCLVSYNGLNGYVMASFLSFSGQTVTPPASQTGGTAVVTTASGSLNLRAEGRSGSTILRTIPQYATVAVLTRANDWCYVTYENTTGYVMTVFLTFANAESAATSTPTPTLTPAPTFADGSTATPTPSPTPAPSLTPAPAPQTMTAMVYTASGSLNLRYAPSGGAQVLCAIPRLATVTVLSLGDAWCQVAYNGMEGYAMTRYLSIDQGAATPAPAPTDAAASAQLAWVLTASGSLNLREAPDRNARVLTTLPRLAEVNVLAALDGWRQVSYSGVVGYVMAEYLTLEDPYGRATASPTPTPAPTASAGQTAAGQADTPTPSPSPTPTPAPSAAPQPALDSTLRTVEQDTVAYVNPREDQNMLILWPECREQGEGILNMPRNAEVVVWMIGDQWCYVRYQEKAGYCLTSYLDIRQP